MGKKQIGQAVEGTESMKLIRPAHVEEVSGKLGYNEQVFRKKKEKREGPGKFTSPKVATDLKNNSTRRGEKTTQTQDNLKRDSSTIL